VNISSSNFSLYGEMSSRVMNIQSDYSPNQETYSIDEYFLEVSGVLHNITECGFKMRRHVLTWIGIPVSVDVTPTKSLSKVAVIFVNFIKKRNNELNSKSYFLRLSFFYSNNIIFLCVQVGIFKKQLI